MRRRRAGNGSKYVTFNQCVRTYVERICVNVCVWWFILSHSSVQSTSSNDVALYRQRMNEKPTEPNGRQNLSGKRRLVYKQHTNKKTYTHTIVVHCSASCLNHHHRCTAIVIISFVVVVVIGMSSVLSYILRRDADDGKRTWLEKTCTVVRKVYGEIKNMCKRLYSAGHLMMNIVLCGATSCKNGILFSYFANT